VQVIFLASEDSDRAKLGSKRHLICDGRGIPLAIQLTGANRHDSQHALTLVDAIPLRQRGRGRPRHRPNCVFGDRGYDAESIRQGLPGRGILPLLAMRNTEHGSGLGRWRWVVERTFAWLNQFRRLRVRYEKRADIHELRLERKKSEHTLHSKVSKTSSAVWGCRSSGIAGLVSHGY